MCYMKNSLDINFLELPQDESTFTKRKNGKACKFLNLEKWGAGSYREDAPSLYYSILDPNGNKYYPHAPDGRPGRWRKKPETLDKDHIVWVQKRGKLVPCQVFYFKELESQRRIVKERSILYNLSGANTAAATKELQSIFGKRKFPNPKPSALIKKLVSLVTRKDSIVLDSFAGSGTTAQAVLELNKEDDGDRKFILIECENYANSITAERIRRVIRGVPKARSEILKNGLGGTFSYFKLGAPIDALKMLKGENLPSWPEVARFVYFNATGEVWSEKNARPKDFFVGRSKLFKVYLFYQPEVEWLKSTQFLLRDARKLTQRHRAQDQYLVFAPANAVDDSTLDELLITFCHLPFDIYRPSPKWKSQK